MRCVGPGIWKWVKASARRASPQTGPVVDQPGVGLIAGPLAVDHRYRRPVVPEVERVSRLSELRESEAVRRHAQPGQEGADGRRPVEIWPWLPHPQRTSPAPWAASRIAASFSGPIGSATREGGWVGCAEREEVRDDQAAEPPSSAPPARTARSSGRRSPRRRARDPRPITREGGCRARAQVATWTRVANVSNTPWFAVFTASMRSLKVEVAFWISSRLFRPFFVAGRGAYRTRWSSPRWDSSIPEHPGRSSDAEGQGQGLGTARFRNDSIDRAIAEANSRRLPRG